MAETARDYLIAYGYQEFPDGRFRKLGKRTQIWQPTEGGWLRFEVGPNGEEVPEAHSVAESHQSVSGLDKSQNPEAFNFVYPEEEVAAIYKAASEAAAAGWPESPSG